MGDPQPGKLPVIVEKYNNPSYPLGLEDQLKKVPSTIIREEFNYLINPLHPDFKKLTSEAHKSLYLTPE
jgi:RES domain-containing protein